MNQESGIHIQIEGLTFSYPDGREAIRNVHINIHNGEKVALVGPNGAGKSTLLLHLNGILRGKGLVKIAGQEMNNQHLKQIRSKVGLIFQNPNDQLFSPTVFQDVAYGPIYQGLPQEIIQERVSQALNQVIMSGFEDRVSYHLSLGEKKRIAIATVLSMQPEILILDEPTAGLDPRGRRRIIELLKNIPQTMLIASHDMPLVETLCTRTILINQGQVAADGCTADILGNRDLLLANGL